MSLHLFRTSRDVVDKARSNGVSDKDLEATVLRVVEERLGAREREVNKKAVRIRECHDVIVATLKDAGHAALAEHVSAKINGLYFGGEKADD